MFPILVFVLLWVLKVLGDLVVWEAGYKAQSSAWVKEDVEFFVYYGYGVFVAAEFIWSWFRYHA